MLQTVPDILARIAAHKLERLDAKRPHRDSWEHAAEANRAGRRDFTGALMAHPPAIIAEIKKASPSKGIFTENFHPADIAQIYHRGGAAALSVLTDEEFFHGSLADLKAARSAAPVPVLRKDFTVDEIDIIEAAAAGADAILLIAALLTDQQLLSFRECAERLGLASLVEVHDGEELQRAIDTGARIIGVNNRDLRTFEVHLEISLDLADRIPAAAIKVTESGIHTHAELARLAASGFQAFLVGEHLMKSGDPAAALAKLRGERGGPDPLGGVK